jgi:hydrogenase expression/formation protein hypE
MEHEVITLAHGAGGQLSHALMEEVVLPELGNTILNMLHDGAVLPIAGRAAFTTDSYVVQPHFFPGGSIGRLAVCGTVNDLAMTGAVPRWLSLAVILEEGFPITTLRRIVRDIRTAAEEAGVLIVTGDTKVVPRGCGDGIYINTAGVGEMIEGVDIAPVNVRPGMNIIVSGTLGDHAATVMAARHNLTLPPEIVSDSAPRCHMTPGGGGGGGGGGRDRRPAGPNARRCGGVAERDCTRGGCRHPPRGERDPRTPGGTGRLRSPRVRSADPCE